VSYGLSWKPTCCRNRFAATIAAWSKGSCSRSAWLSLVGVVLLAPRLLHHGSAHVAVPPLRIRFRASGLYHVLAVDGLKVATVGGGALMLVRRVGVDRVKAELAALAAVGGYALAVGFHPAVIRATVAAALGSLAWLSARERDRWHALVVGALVLLAWNPMFVLDAGFQLSFAAVAAIFVVTPRVMRALEGYPVPRSLAQLIGVSTACGLATAPVTWFQFHQVSLVTIPANVVAVPVVAEMLVVALATAVTAPVAPPLAAALAQVNGYGAWFVAGCARTFGGLPGAQATSPATVACVAAGLLLAAALVLTDRGSREIQRITKT
jgi:competence protein ComEC